VHVTTYYNTDKGNNYIPGGERVLMFGGIKGRRRGTTVHIKIIFFGSIVTIR
jgi:hypothetical protein